ncbi:MAG: hypothetical protein ACE144_17210 [Thermodesulfobacteriota bacterium]
MPLLEIIGEAATRIPKENQARDPDILWTEIAGLRHHRHGSGYQDTSLTYYSTKLSCPLALLLAFSRQTQQEALHLHIAENLLATFLIVIQLTPLPLEIIQIENAA